MAVITGDLYQSFTKPESSGGRLVPIAGGKMHVGVWGSDPTEKDANGNYINHIDIYYVNGVTGAKVKLSNPVPLNSAGKPEYQGSVIQVESDEELYSVAIMNSSNQVPPGYANYRSGAKEAFDELNAACQEFGVPYSEAGVSIQRLVSGMNITSVYGLIASDGSLWINNGLSGVVTNVPSPMLGIISIDGVSQSLIKKRDENRYQASYNYNAGDIVTGSDNTQYYCVLDVGPSHGGSVDPISGDAKRWRVYPYSTDSDDNGLYYEKRYDGTMMVHGVVKKDNGLVTPQRFDFKHPFIRVTQSVIPFINNSETVIALAVGQANSHFNLVTKRISDGAQNYETFDIGVSVSGKWI